MRRYRSDEEDSGRWNEFSFRDGDVVVSTRSKHGTTWAQHVCLLLVHGTPELPAPLPELSPWVDWTGAPVPDLGWQPWRRVLKTHTPLDGLPFDPGATFVVCARHPLDAAVSLYHQGANLDRERIARLTGTSVRARTRPPLPDWLPGWVDHVGDPLTELDSLDGVLHHYADAWARRGDANVVLLHYADLSADLDGTMRGLAARLGVEVDEGVRPSLVEAATFEAMQAAADRLAPDPAGVLLDRRAFFREGRSGRGWALLAPAARARYEERTATLDPDLRTWLHR